MNKLYILALTLLSIAATGQSGTPEQLVEAEMKSAYRTMNFTANLNTSDYDVLSHVLEFEVAPDDYYIQGVVTTTFRAKENMDDITFDLTSQLTVNSVTMNGNALMFTQNSNDELVINFPSVITANSQATVVIDYEGEPASDNDAFAVTAHATGPELWTLSEPYGAKDWWPCKQDLNDKVDNIDVYITAPSQYVSVSNGLELGQTDNGDGTKTTHFQHNYPIPAYLIAIAVNNYQVFTQTAGTAPNTFPIVNYIYPEQYDFITTQQLPLTPQMIAVYESHFGTYPFHEEKYGHAQCSLGGGMEHTTVSFVSGFGRELVAHELAHQWFGDKVTCGSWKDIWLNEGFATYLSGMVVEAFDGEENFTNWKMNKINNVTVAPFGSVYLTDADTLNVSRIFSSRLSYDKGAMVAHMLRYKLGDEVFFQGMQNYLNDPDLAYGYAKTPDLQAHLEAASGISLNEFFQDWVYKQGYPSYTISLQNWSGGMVKITVNQSQSNSSVSYFEMPLTLKLYGGGGQETEIVVDNTFNGQEFVVPAGFYVTGFEFDPHYDIISKDNQDFLGEPQFSNLQNIKLYPNPANDRLTVELPEGVTLQQALFYNALGQKVMEANGATWNVASLSAGVHFLTLITDKGNKQLKFVKE